MRLAYATDELGRATGVAAQTTTFSARPGHLSRHNRGATAQGKFADIEKNSLSFWASPCRSRSRSAWRAVRPTLRADERAGSADWSDADLSSTLDQPSHVLPPKGTS